MEDYKLFVQRIGLVGISNILVNLSSLILLPILTKNLSVSEYGIWVQVNISVLLISIIVTLGLPYTMIRYLASEKNNKVIREVFYSIFFIILCVNTMVSIILFLFSEFIANIICGGNYEVALIIPLITFFASLNNLLLSFFRALQQIKSYSLFYLIQSYLTLLLASFLILKGYGIFGAIAGLLLTNLLLFVIMLIITFSKISFKIPTFTGITEYINFGLPLVPSDLSNWALTSSDRYIIGFLLGLAYVGYYSPGYTIGYIVIMFVLPFSTILPTVLPKYYDSGETEKLRSFIKNTFKYFLILAIPAVIGLSVLSKEILTVLTTSEIALNGYQITIFTASSALVLGLYEISLQVLMLVKKTKVLGLLWVAVAFSNILLNFIFIPYLGIIGAGITTLISYVLISISVFVYSKKYFKFDFDVPTILKSLISSVLMLIVICYVSPTSLIDLILVIILSIIVYFGSLVALGGINKKELNFIRSLLSN